MVTSNFIKLCLSLHGRELHCTPVYARQDRIRRASSHVAIWLGWLACLVMLSSWTPYCLATEMAPAPNADLAVDGELPPTEANEPDGLDELDAMLNMDLDSLANAAVKQESSFTDPIVEGVSKKEESLTRSPGIVDVITAEDIEQFGAKNLYEVLQRATSVFMTGSFLHRRNVASIRGNLQNHEDNHVLILINGRPFRDVTLGGLNMSIYTAFPLQTIRHIEVIRGPGSVLYGTNAFNGVINIVTKNPDAPTFQASTLQGTYGWQSYSLMAGNGNQDRKGLAGVTQNRQQGWPFTATSLDPPGPASATTETNPWGEDNVGVFTMYRYKGFTSNLFVARSTQEIIGPDGLYPSDRQLDTRVFLDLGYNHEFDDWQSLHFNFTYNYDNNEFPSVAVLPFISNSHSFFLESNYRAAITDYWNFLAGGYVDFHLGEAFVPGSGNSIDPFNETWYGLYLQTEYQATEWLKLVGGMQANLPGDIPGGIVPRAAAIASLNEHWTAKLLYGQAFRSPYRIERFINVPGILFGNPDLIPETIQTFDAQLEYRNELFRAAATYFHSDYFDIIARVGFPQTYINDGMLEFDGVELESDWNMTERLRFLGSTTYQRNVRDGVENTTSAPNWMAKMGLAYQTQHGLTLGLFDTYFSDQTVAPTAVAVNGDPSAYHLASLNSTLDLDRYFHWRTGRKMQVQFLIQNLFDQEINHFEFEREEINSLPAGPGRTYYGGFTLSY